MRKTLVLHVGHYKTGTTALQVFLAQNRKALLRRGVDYAEEFLVHAKHSKLAFSIYRKAQIDTLMHGFRDPMEPETAWARMFEYVAASKAPCVLVSSEEFMRMGAHPQAAEILRRIVESARAEMDFRVIGYLRSPGAHLRSWYNQLVKMNTQPPDFNAAVTGMMEPVHYDYELAVKPWADIFGTEAVTLRPYLEGMRSNGGLMRDFLAQLGVDFDRAPAVGGWQMPSRDVNPRLDDRLLELTRAMQEAGLDADLRTWILQRESRKLPDAGGPAEFDAIATRSLSGLQALSSYGLAEDVLQDFSDDRVQPDPQWQAELARMTAVLLRDQEFLRRRLNTQNADLTARLRATEDRLVALERRLGLDEKA